MSVFGQDFTRGVLTMGFGDVAEIKSVFEKSLFLRRDV
jgi:hypothetical protein